MKAGFLAVHTGHWKLFFLSYVVCTKKNITVSGSFEHQKQLNVKTDWKENVLNFTLKNSNRLSDNIPPQMKILNTVIP